MSETNCTLTFSDGSTKEIGVTDQAKFLVYLSEYPYIKDIVNIKFEEKK